MFIYIEHDGYSCALLEPDDFTLFAQTRRACFQDKAQTGDHDVFDPQRIADKDAHYWRKIFDDDDTRFFILRDADDKPVGMIDLIISEDEGRVYLESVHILSSHRGRGFSHYLYDACEYFIADSNTHDHVYMRIDARNIVSQYAAEANGYNAGETESDGKILYCKTLDIPARTLDFNNQHKASHDLS